MTSIFIQIHILQQTTTHTSFFLYHSTGYQFIPRDHFINKYQLQ